MNHKIWPYLLCVLVSFSGAVPHGAVQYGAVQYGAVPHGAVQYEEVEYGRKFSIRISPDGFLVGVPWPVSTSKALEALNKGESKGLYQILILEVKDGKLQSVNKLPEKMEELEENINFNNLMRFLAQGQALCRINPKFGLEVEIDYSDETVKITLSYCDHPVSYSGKQTEIDKGIHEDMDPKAQKMIDKILKDYLRGNKIKKVKTETGKEEIDFNSVNICKHKFNADMIKTFHIFSEAFGILVKIS